MFKKPRRLAAFLLPREWISINFTPFHFIMAEQNKLQQLFELLDKAERLVSEFEGGYSN